MSTEKDRCLNHKQELFEKTQDQLAKNRALAALQSKSYLQKSLPLASNDRQESQEGSGLVLTRLKVIHNFNKTIRVMQELKVVKSQSVVKKRIQPPNPPPKPALQHPNPVNPSPVSVREDPSEPSQSEIPEPQIVETTKPNYQVYRLGDVFNGRRVLMQYLGIDVGTKTVVVAYKDNDGNVNYLSEINGYWPFERCTPFIENMLNDPNKKRSDGTERPARWIKLPDSDVAIVLGKDAEEFAYAKNDTLLRPMAEGGISADEEAMTVLGSIVQGLIEMAENEVGKFGDGVKICYCTTAPALNKDSNVDYHERVVTMIIEGYETDTALSVCDPVKESHAIVIDMSNDGTGIGISWGAGTVTVSYVKYGLEIYSFCWVGAGDWIDEQVAMRHGYDPEMSKTRKRTARETPTTVAKRKLTIDLSEANPPDDRVGLDICLHYDVLISQVIGGIVQGFIENESEARIDDAIDVFMAGGTSSPSGFAERVAAKFDEAAPPFEIGLISKSDKPLYSVATGCLKAAELF